MKSTLTLMSELEDALKRGDSGKRVLLLRQITDLFLSDASRLNEEQVAVFDDILSHLALRLEERVRAELSQRVAPVANAPIALTKNLANDPSIAVAGPVLEHSTRISERDLIDIARVQGQDHLLAISSRAAISEQLTDVLVGRGDKRVINKLAGNSGARFSQVGFTAMMKNAESDDELTALLGSRLDLPLKLLKQLFARASDLVRSRLLAIASPERQQRIQSILADVAGELGFHSGRAAAETTVKHLNREGKLSERVLIEFAEQRQYDEVAETLSLFCSAPFELIDNLIRSDDIHGVLVACKAANLGWPVADAILQAGFSDRTVSNEDIAEARGAYLILSGQVAQRTMRFMAAQVTAKQPVAPVG